MYYSVVRLSRYFSQSGMAINTGRPNMVMTWVGIFNVVIFHPTTAVQLIELNLR